METASQTANEFISYFLTKLIYEESKTYLKSALLFELGESKDEHPPMIIEASADKLENIIKELKSVCLIIQTPQTPYVGNLKCTNILTSSHH